jgi:hypothetical protein
MKLFLRGDKLFVFNRLERYISVYQGLTGVDFEIMLHAVEQMLTGRKRKAETMENRIETTMKLTANTVRQLAEREYSNVYKVDRIDNAFPSMYLSYKVDRIDNAFPSMYLSQWSVTLLPQLSEDDDWEFLTAGPIAVIRDLGDGTAILCTNWNYVTGYTETLVKY